MHKFSIINLVDIESKNELILIDNTEHFYIYSRDSFVLQRVIDMKSGKNKEYCVDNISEYFWIDHLNQLCGADKENFYLFDKDFQVSETRTQNVCYSHCHSMIYSKINKKVYAAVAQRGKVFYSLLKWDENLNQESYILTFFSYCKSSFTIKNYQDFIYFFDRNYVHILDLSLNYIGIIGQDILKNPSQLIADANNSNYIIIQAENFFFVFSVHNFQYVGSFKRSIYYFEKCIFN